MSDLQRPSPTTAEAKPSSSSGSRRALTPHDAAQAYIVASAELGALIEASRAACDLTCQIPATRLAGRLRRHAARLAESAVARDQVLRLALLAAATDLTRRPSAAREPCGSSVLRNEPDAAARNGVRAMVIASPLVAAAEAHRVVEDLERRHQPEAADRRDLALRLMSEADLHRLVWDDPRIACAPAIRRVMRSSIGFLLDRATRLAPGLEGRRKELRSSRDWRAWRVDIIGRAWSRWSLAALFLWKLSGPLLAEA